MSTPTNHLSRRRFLRLIAVQSTALAAGLRAGARDDLAAPVTWQGIALGTEASIQIHGLDRGAAGDLLRRCRDEILRLEAIFSLYDSHSALARLNRDGRLENAPPELGELVARASQCSELTGGAFDISVQPLCELYARGDAAIPDDEVRRVRALIDYRQIECSESGIRLGLPGMKLTLNGAAQGYITDRVAELLHRHGCRHVLVDLGEKRALGPRSPGRPWRLGLASPFTPDELVDVIELDDRALATSAGSGTRFAGGRHHLLDARSGGCRNDFASVSVLAPTATVADLLSTSLAVVAPDAVPRLLAHFPGTEAHVVLPDGKLRRFGAAG